MKFYGREKELKALEKIQEISKETAQLTVVTGRRRIGKTTLLKKACEKLPMIYFFVGRKTENLLCDELCDAVKAALDIDLGNFNSISRLLEVLLKLSRNRHFTLILDEFQNFKYANESIFSELQNVWDINKNEAHIHLILCGSVQTMMEKIFGNKCEPLYGRANNRLTMKPFSTKILTEILEDHNANFVPDDLLALYMTTGGVAKYVEEMMNHKATTKLSIIEEFISTSSYFIPEGRDMLNDEFGRESNTYFSILSAIANGKNTRGNIKNYTEIEPGGYLDRLENDYNIITRQRPYGVYERSQNVKYTINDMFLRFWFRFVYKYSSAIEIGNTEYVLQKILADYEVYSGIELENFFRQKVSETGLYNIVTNYWEKNGENEIDLIAINEFDKKMLIAEIKRNPQKINLNVLKDKAMNIVDKKWEIEYRGLSLENMKEFCSAKLMDNG